MSSSLRACLVAWYDPRIQGLDNQGIVAGAKLWDLTGQGLDMTLYNFASTKESGIREDGALVFDGVDDFMQVDASLTFRDCTVIADRDIKQDAAVGATGFKSIWTTTITYAQFGFEYHQRKGNVVVNEFGNGGYEAVPALPSGVAWRTLTTYANATTTIALTHGAQRPTSAGLAVNGSTMREGLGGYWKVLRSLIIFNRSLTVEEIGWVRRYML